MYKYVKIYLKKEGKHVVKSFPVIIVISSGLGVAGKEERSRSMYWELALGVVSGRLFYY